MYVPTTQKNGQEKVSLLGHRVYLLCVLIYTLSGCIDDAVVPRDDNAGESMSAGWPLIVASCLPSWLSAALLADAVTMAKRRVTIDTACRLHGMNDERAERIISMTTFVSALS